MNSKTLQSQADANASIKIMSTPQKMQQYMERHRLGQLFENLMNKVLHEQPEDPYIYLIKALYKKAGIDVPRDLRSQGIRKSSPERIIQVQRSRSPEMSRKAAAQAWGSTSIGEKERSYDKPWLSSSKKIKTKSEDLTSSKQGASPRPASSRSKLYTLSSRSPRPPFTPDIESLDEVLHVQQKPISPGGRQPKQQPWNADTKVSKTSFDDLFSEQAEETKTTKKKETKTETQQSWGNIGLGDDDRGAYTSGVYRGPKTNYDDSDPLAGELMNCKQETTTETQSSIPSSDRVRGRRVDAKKHRKELEELINKSDQKSDDSGYDEVKEENDDAIELLEDAESLKNEGVTNIPKSGYKLSRILKHREEEGNIKLNINLYAGSLPADSVLGDGGYNYPSKAESLFDSDEDRPATGMSGFRSSPGDSDEEFESVSQVTGPRRPVWNVADDSDGDSFYPKASKTLPIVSRSANQDSQKTDKRLTSTAPVRFEDSSMQQSLSSQGQKKAWPPGIQATQSVESVRSTDGGWQLPQYESDTEWSEYGDRSARNRPPRAY